MTPRVSLSQNKTHAVSCHKFRKCARKILILRICYTFSDKLYKLCVTKLTVQQLSPVSVHDDDRKFFALITGNSQSLHLLHPLLPTKRELH